jgi:hypothetical protein
MNQEAGIEATAVDVEAPGQTRLERMKAKQQERNQKSQRRAEQTKPSEESKAEVSAEVVEPGPAARRPAAHALPPQLPWWYRWSYRVSMAGCTFALVMYGVGCLLLLVFVLAVLAAILL